MRNEWGRLASFDTFPTDIPALTLVKHGYYYDRCTKIIRCSGCECKLSETNLLEHQMHSSDCLWRNLFVPVDASKIDNPPSTSTRFNIIADTEAGLNTSRRIQIADADRPSEQDTRRVRRKCSLRYFIGNYNHGTGASNTLSIERQLDNAREVKYERGPMRNDHDRLCLKGRNANSRWDSFLSHWQHRQLDANNLLELKNLCFMLSRVGFFLISQSTGETTSEQMRFKLELACSLCKRIEILEVSFEYSAEENLEQLLHRHRLAVSYCPLCFDLEGIVFESFQFFTKISIPCLISVSEFLITYVIINI